MDIKALGAFKDVEGQQVEKSNQTDVDEFTIATLITFKDGARLFYLAEEDGLDQQAVENAYENAKYEYERLYKSNKQELNKVAKKLKGIKFKVAIEYVSTLWDMWDSFVDNAVPFADAPKENSGKVIAIEVIDAYGYSEEEDAIEAATKLFFSEVISGKVTKVVDIYSRIGNIMDIKEKIDSPEAEFSEYDILEKRKANHLDQILFLPSGEFEGWASSDNWGFVLEENFRRISKESSVFQYRDEFTIKTGYSIYSVFNFALSICNNMNFNSHVSL